MQLPRTTFIFAAVAAAIFAAGYGSRTFSSFFIAAAKSANRAEFVSQSVPTQVRAGEVFTVTINVKNIGTTSWTRAGAYRLGSIMGDQPGGSR